MRVLVVEDDEVLGDGLKVGLGLEGFTVDVVTCCEEARAAASLRDHEVIVLDIALPDGSGLDLLREWRTAGYAMPIVMLTARSLVEDRIGGLDAGADDYLGKPFDLGELLARLDALVRRAQEARPETTLVVDDLAMDLLTHKVTRAGKTIALQPREFKLLEYLMRHANQVVTRTMLLENVWDYNFDPQTNVVDVHVSKLRQKIDTGGRPLLRTVRNAGYRLTADE